MQYYVYYKTLGDCARFISKHKTMNMAIRKLKSINGGKLKPSGLERAWFEDKKSENCQKYNVDCDKV